MNRVSYRVSHRLTRQSLGCRAKNQLPLRGRAAAGLEHRRQLIQRARCVAPKRAVVSVDDKGLDGAIAAPVIASLESAAPIDDLSPLSSVVAPSTVDPLSSTSDEVSLSSPQSNFLQGFSPVWIGWLLMALLLSAWAIVKIVMV